MNSFRFGVRVKGIPQGRYTKEFREEAVKLVTEEKLSFLEAGRRLSLPPTTLANWVKQFKAGRPRLYRGRIGL